MPARKSIFITGAASGIGLATARLFAEKGWYVGGGDVSVERLAALELKTGGIGCCFSVMDVTETESVRAALEKFSAATGGNMDILFNCAGILRMGLHHKIPLEEQKRTVDVNFNGILNCIHASLDLLKTTPESRIINMSSASAVYGTPELAVYSAVKFAVKGLTEALNIEFERLGIHVCDVMAPYVNTPMIADSDVKAASVSRLGVHLEARDVAEVVWKAAGRKKVHYRVGWFINVLMLLTWAFPFSRRVATKYLAMSAK
jgi:NAD(P)-dependent dehydrogenase (short-subunit alcohol dehydrogenase family)